MSSVHRAFSQVAPFKRYVATGSAQLYDLNGSGAVVSSGAARASGSVFRDMGKMKYSADGLTVLRKVQMLPVNDSSPIVTGYIKLGDASVAGQNIVALN